MIDLPHHGETTGLFVDIYNATYFIDILKNVNRKPKRKEKDFISSSSALVSR